MYFGQQLKKCLKNASRFTATETGLVTAMHTFGTYSGVQHALKVKYAKSVTRRCHKTTTGVQPTSIGRREHSLAGKKNITAGRPHGEVKNTCALLFHDHTTFGHLQS
ncbi:hypothetical protein AVEN_273147-1 [Araneus ventricosus]|uniref:Uncharacterized protein n=1 Tax=Araneus ventricosus TaxID=182803 RepID=A0A4Y2JLT3_ARAVE|nr:hypothetical protein AVEN_273147-1 [Araneus ventricosus]